MKRMFLRVVISVTSLLLLGMEQGYCSTQAVPPKQIPPGLYNDFTLHGQIPVSHWYRDDSYSPANAVVFTAEQVNANLAKISRKEWNYYGATDGYLYAALEKYQKSFRGKTVAIIGSVTPWYESIVLFYGGIPTTIEYNKIISTDPRLKVLTVEEYERNPQLFDILLSISSIEHDGLGRYGDPINPVGDYNAMRKHKLMLKEGGLYFLSVPVGKDHLWWNVHRIYGRIRLPKLIEGWKLIDSFGFQDKDFYCERGIDSHQHQPIFVLVPR